METSISLKYFYTLLCLSLTLNLSPPNYLGLKTLQIKTTNNNLLYFFCHKTNEYSKLEYKDSWKKGVFLSTNNDTLGIIANYINPQSIIIIINNTTCRLYPEKTKAIAIGDHVYISSKHEENDQHFIEYFELLSEGAYCLLKKDGDYYYKSAGGLALKLKKNKRAFLNLFGQEHKMLADFLTINKINLKKEQDLIRTFVFLNFNKENKASNSKN